MSELQADLIITWTFFVGVLAGVIIGFIFGWMSESQSDKISRPEKPTRKPFGLCPPPPPGPIK